MIWAPQENWANREKYQVGCPLEEEYTFKDDLTSPSPEKQSGLACHIDFQVSKL